VRARARTFANDGGLLDLLVDVVRLEPLHHCALHLRQEGRGRRRCRGRLGLDRTQLAAFAARTTPLS